MTADTPDRPPDRSGTRSNLVRCPKHGRIYDSTRTQCPACLAEAGGDTDATPAPASAASPTPSTRQGLPPAVLLGIVTAILAVVVVPKILQKTRNTGSEAAPAGAARDRSEGQRARSEDDHPRFDPENYRAPIEALEAAVYAPAASQDVFAAGGRVSNAARELMTRVMERNRVQMVARQFADSMLRLQALADAGTEGGYTAPNLEVVARSWENIRDLFFRPADWFHAPLPPPASAPVGPPAADDLAPVRQARAFATELENLIQLYRPTLLNFPDAAPSDPRQAQTLRQSWMGFVRNWQDGLERAERGAPRAGAYRMRDREAAFRLEEATRELDRAFNALRDAATPSGIPYRSRRDQLLSQARGEIARARERLGAFPD